MEERRGLWGIPKEALSNLLPTKKHCIITGCVAQDITILVEGVQAIKSLRISEKLFQHFHTYLRGVVPAIKPHLSHHFRGLLSNHSATSLCSKTALDLRDPYYLCSCEFIRIREEPLIPPDSCSTVPTVLCGLVPVCGSVIVRIAG
jgi:hypothetical protein